MREGVLVPNDSQVSLQAVGIMGERNVTIVRGKSPHAIAEGDTINGVLLMGLGEVMGKAGDIIDEVEKRLRSVKLAAGKARNYQAYQQRLRELRSRYALSEYHGLRTTQNGLERETADLSDEATRLRTEISNNEARASEATVRVNDLERGELRGGRRPPRPAARPQTGSPGWPAAGVTATARCATHELEGHAPGVQRPLGPWL